VQTTEGETSSGRAFGHRARRVLRHRSGLRSPGRASPKRVSLVEGVLACGRRSPSREGGGSALGRVDEGGNSGIGEATGRQRFGRIVSLREDKARGRDDRLAEAGRPRVKRGGSPESERVSAQEGFGSGTRRGCSPLKTEECGLHVLARRACSVAHRGLFGDPRCGSLAMEGSRRARWRERLSNRWRNGCGCFE
jgi:hypothetical protein